MSKDVLGVDVVDVSVNVAFDFRLALGKYPNDLRGTLRISTGSGKEVMATQESCLRPCSAVSEVVREMSEVGEVVISPL